MSATTLLWVFGGVLGWLLAVYLILRFFHGADERTDDE